MAKWRCETDIMFDKEDDAVAFLNLLQEVKERLFKGAGGEKIPIIATCRYHECYHDETPPKPCGNYVHYDLKSAEKVDVKNKSGVKVDADTLLKKGGAI